MALCGSVQYFRVELFGIKLFVLQHSCVESVCLFGSEQNTVGKRSPDDKNDRFEGDTL